MCGGIPNEVQGHIFTFLTPENIVKLRRASRGARQHAARALATTERLRFHNGFDAATIERNEKLFDVVIESCKHLREIELGRLARFPGEVQ